MSETISDFKLIRNRINLSEFSFQPVQNNNKEISLRQALEITVNLSKIYGSNRKELQAITKVESFIKEL